jgi:hypothetical protein
VSGIEEISIRLVHGDFCFRPKNPLDRFAPSAYLIVLATARADTYEFAIGELNNGITILGAWLVTRGDDPYQIIPSLQPSSGGDKIPEKAIPPCHSIALPGGTDPPSK